MGFPGGSVVKNPPANAGDVGLARGSGRPPGEENGNPLQYSCLGNPMKRGACISLVHMCVLSHFGRVQLCATLWTVAHQAPLSMEFSRQEHWKRLLNRRFS